MTNDYSVFVAAYGMLVIKSFGTAKLKRGNGVQLKSCPKSRETFYFAVNLHLDGTGRKV